MSRRRKIFLTALILLPALLAVNAYVTARQTKPAELSVQGAQLMKLEAATVQVLDEGPTAETAGETAPIVLIHCYTCSMRWWDKVGPSLAAQHRVVRIDLLGHGGSEKPRSGYTIENQAALVAQVLARLEIQGAVVVGHSLGGAVATSVAETASELVDRVVIIDTPPSPDSRQDFGFVAKLARAPLIGPGSWRLTPDFILRSAIKSDAFAPGFDLADGFEDENQPVKDLRAMTYSSFHDSPDGFADFIAASSLADRIDGALVPALVIMGSEDGLIDVDAATAEWEAIDSAEVEIIDGSGHSPNVENPDAVAGLILDFAAAAAPVPSEPASPSDRKPTAPRPANRSRSAPTRDSGERTPRRHQDAQSGRRQAGQSHR